MSTYYESDETESFLYGPQSETWWDERLASAGDNQSEKLAVRATRLMLNIKNKQGSGRVKLYKLNIAKFLKRREQGRRIVPEKSFSIFNISTVYKQNKSIFKLNMIDNTRGKVKSAVVFKKDNNVDSFEEFVEDVINYIEDNIDSKGWTVVERS